MESNTYKLKPKKLKGMWALYIVILGVMLLFINTKLALPITTAGALLMFKYKNDPKNLSIFNYNLALKLYSKNELSKVKGLLKNAIEYDNNNKEALLFLGTLLFDGKDYTNALKFLSKGEADKVNDPSLVYILGRCYFHVEEYDKAIDYLTRIEYADASDFERGRLYTLARSYFENKDYENACTTFDKFTYESEELKGESLEYYYYLGVTYYYVNRLDKAKDIIKRVYDTDCHYKDIKTYAEEIELV